MVGNVFFLIPFEAIGVVMFAGLVFTLLEPAHRIVWRFYNYEIEVRHTWFGFGPRRAWPVDRLGRLEVRKDTAVSRLMRFNRGMRSNGNTTPGELGYRLWFINPANEEICSIKRLTGGEAQWIGQTILSERVDWFDKRSP